ncbi:MAG: type II toxin-antitoxin system VapC family toxin [Deltaproteobacteria bacterium]|nr:type II toxin-antitoxin system VapC family toxin [Deltaproteobacteria bacterium]
MILYLDTSALVKLYVAESDSRAVHEAVSQAEVVCTSRVSWAELMSALARKERESPPDAELLGAARRAFRAQWASFLVLEVTQEVVEQAGRLATAMSLRAYDGIQLASAEALRSAARPHVVFGCFDVRLNRAATALGMHAAFDREG